MSGERIISGTSGKGAGAAHPRGSAGLRGAMALGLLSLFLATYVWADGVVRHSLLRESRGRTLAELVPYGHSLSIALERRLGKLEALHLFALKELGPDGQMPEEEFEAHASGLAATIQGIRLMAIAPAGVQRFVYPVEANQGAAGMNLLAENGSGPIPGVRRAIESDQATIETRRGQDGKAESLVVRRSVVRQEEFIGLVVLAFDLAPIFEEAGLAPPPPHLEMAVRDSQASNVHGAAGRALEDPVIYRLGLESSPWELQAVPSEGWGDSIRKPMLRFRIVAAVIAGLIMLIALLASNRNRFLEREIERRTRDLTASNRELRDQVEERRAAESALRESEERLERTQAVSLIMMLHVSLEGRWMKLTDSFAEALGYRPEELLGRHFSELTHPDDVVVDLEQYERLKTGQAQTYDLEKRFIRKDGEILWMYVNRSVVTDREGHPVHFLLYLRDITHEEKARQALQESEERYRRIFESSNEGLYIYSPMGKVIDVNPAASRIHGLSREALLGRRPDELTTPESYETLQEMARTVSAGREAQGEVQALRGDGSTVELEMHVVPYLMKGERLGLGIARDITERKRAEAERARLEAERESLIGNLQLTLDRMPIGCILTDPNLRISYWNPSAEQIFGYGPAEVLDRVPVEFLVEASSRGAVEFEYERLASGERTGTSIVRNLTREGRTILCEWNNVPLKDPGGALLGVLAMCQDITNREEAALALRESEGRYRSLVDAMTSFVWTTDAKGRFVTPQKAWEAYTGLEWEQQRDFRWISSIHPEDRDAMGASWNRAVSSNGFYEAAARLWHAQSGEYRYTTARAAPVFKEDGTVKEWIGTVTDTHDRTLAEQALEESRERYRTIVETAGEGIWLVDREWKTSFVNARLCELLGYEEAEMLGRPVTAFIDDEERAKLEQHMRRRERGESEVYQLRLRRKSGSDLWALMSTRALQDGAGQFIGSLGMVTDITDRVIAERTLQENERRLATLMGNLPGMAYRCKVDAHWTMEFVSAGCMELTGHPPEKLIGNSSFTFVDLIVREDYGLVAGGVAQAVRNREPFHLVYRIRTAQGAIKWVWEQGLGIFTEAGELVALEGFITDISERKRAEEEVRQLNEELESRVAERTEQLSEANRELESFSYSVSHDLRAPLRGIDGFARILEGDYGPSLEPEARRYLSLVRRNAQQMGRLIDDLLNFSRMNRQPVTRIEVDTGELVAQAIEALAAETNGREVRVEIGNLPKAQADPTLLRQVFANLLSNAFKFTRGRGEALIEIGSRQDAGEGTVYFVRDNGVGFDMKYKDKLFGVFQRLHRAEDYEGTGVGLALIQRIVRRHGGRIWAEAAPEQGAAFYFTLGEGTGHE